MYTAHSDGVGKTVESWTLTIPLHDNDGKEFGDAAITAILDEMSLDYPGYTIVSSIGRWSDGMSAYLYHNIQVVVDIMPRDVESSELFSLI